MSKKTTVQEAGGSLDDHIERIRKAWRVTFREFPNSDYSYVVDVFPDYVVARQGDYDAPSPKYFQVGYVDDGENVIFAPKSEWLEVELGYSPIGETETDDSSVTEAFRGLIEAESGKAPEAVILVAGLSLNGNHYTKEALSSGKNVFSGAKMYADHPSASEERDRPERSVRDLVGKLGEAYIGKDKDGNEALRAPIVLSETAGWLQSLIQEGIAEGLSIRAHGKGKREKNGDFTVTDFVESPHTSVDFVTVPSAGGYAELSESARESFWNGITRDEVKKHRPEILEETAEKTVVKLLEESSMKPEEIQSLEESNRKLLEENERLFATVRKNEAGALLEGLLSEALPKVTREKISEQAKPILEAYAVHGNTDKPDDLKKSLAEIVEAEKAYISKIAPNGVVDGLGNTYSQDHQEGNISELEEAFGNLLSEEEAKIAAKGRGF